MAETPWKVPWSVIYPVKDHESRARLLTLERMRDDLVRTSDGRPINLAGAEARLVYATQLVALKRGLDRAPPPVLLYHPEFVPYPPLKVGPLQTSKSLATNQLRVELLFAATALTVAAVQQKPGPEVTPRVLPLLRRAMVVVSELRQLAEAQWVDRGDLPQEAPCLVEPLSVARHLAALHMAFDAHLLQTPELRKVSVEERLEAWRELMRHRGAVTDYPYLGHWLHLGLAQMLLDGERAWSASTIGLKWQAKEWLHRVCLDQPREAEQCAKHLQLQHLRVWHGQHNQPPPCLEAFFRSGRDLYESKLLVPEQPLPVSFAVQIGKPE